MSRNRWGAVAAIIAVRGLCLAALGEHVSPGSTPRDVVQGMYGKTHPEIRGAIDLRPLFKARGLAPRGQGRRDSCSLFAITALAEVEYARFHPEASTPLSEEFLLWAANQATGRRGDQAMFYEAVHGLNALGICRAELHPYRTGEGADPTPSDAAIAEARTRCDRWRVGWIRRWDVRRPLDEDAMTAIKSVLSQGHPVACGLRWPTVLPGAELMEVVAPEEVFDGHSIVITGYQDDGQAAGGGVFRFRNSAGPEWGDHGYGVMSYAYARAYANDALWLTCGPPGSEAPAQRLECEMAPVLSSDPPAMTTQRMASLGEQMWSGAHQLLCRTDAGDRIEFGVRVARAGRYRVRVLATAAPDYGLIRTELDGNRCGPDVDLYAGRICPAGSLELGEFDLSQGIHPLGIEVVGKNPASTGFFVGLDAIDLLTVAEHSSRASGNAALDGVGHDMQ